jgi:hypothetical protein
MKNVDPVIPDWGGFQERILVKKDARIHRCHSNPFVDLFYDGSKNRIGLMVQIRPADDVPEPLTRLENIYVEKVHRSPEWFVSVSINKEELFQPFYGLMRKMAETVIENRAAPFPALLREVRTLEELLKKRASLSIEKQLGLFGELTVLRRVLLNIPSSSSDCWMGPASDSHDFRLSEIELEVKTALSAQRAHTIHGFRQLMPSEKHQLALVSVLLARTVQDDGESLPELVSAVSEIIRGKGQSDKEFSDKVSKVGYEKEDADLYQDRYVLRQPLLYAPIEIGFPKITWATIQQALGFEAPRIADLQYDLRVDGLGPEEGQEGFPSFLLKNRT